MAEEAEYKAMQEQQRAARPNVVIHFAPFPADDDGYADRVRTNMRRDQLQGRVARKHTHFYAFVNEFSEAYVVRVHDPIAGKFSLWGDETLWTELKFPEDASKFMLGNSEPVHIKRILQADAALRSAAGSGSHSKTRKS